MNEMRRVRMARLVKWSLAQTVDAMMNPTHLRTRGTYVVAAMLMWLAGASTPASAQEFEPPPMAFGLEAGPGDATVDRQRRARRRDRREQWAEYSDLDVRVERGDGIVLLSTGFPLAALSAGLIPLGWHVSHLGEGRGASIGIPVMVVGTVGAATGLSLGTVGAFRYSAANRELRRRGAQYVWGDGDVGGQATPSAWTVLPTVQVGQGEPRVAISASGSF